MNKVMMHKITGDLVEMTESWFGKIIWLKDFETLNPNSPPKKDDVIYSDDERFHEYTQIGEC